MAGSISYYLEKAINSVNHDLLLSKLPYCGISVKAKLLLKLIFRIDIKEFKILTHILILTQSQNGPK